MSQVVVSPKQKKDVINIVVVGDARVGKTTLINTFLSESFSELVPSVLKPMTIPADTTPDRIALSVFDTVSASSVRQVVVKHLLGADVIMLVASYDDEQSLQNVKSVWFKLFEDINSLAPVVLVVNKSDLSSNNIHAYANLLNDLRVEAYVETSCKTLSFVSQAFHVAQHTALFPIRPLFDFASRSLRPKYARALNRLFRIFDRDNDHKLNDAELSDYEEACFGVRPNEAQLIALKRALKRQPGVCVQDEMITLHGFLTFHQLMIQKRKVDIAWSMILKFGYGEDLALREDAVALPSALKNRKADQSCELSDRALSFLKDVFAKFDQDKDGTLSTVAPADESKFAAGASAGGESEFEQAFASCDDIPLPDNFAAMASTTGGQLTLVGWLSLWSYLALWEPEKTVRSLAYLGFAPFDANSSLLPPKVVANHPSGAWTLADALKLNKSRKEEEHAKRLARTSLYALVFGSGSSGKSALSTGLVAPDAASVYKVDSVGWVEGDFSPPAPAISDAAAATDAGAKTTKKAKPKAAALTKGPAGAASVGDTKRGVFLTLKETPDDIKQSMALLGPHKEATKADLIILAFKADDSASLDYITQLSTKLPEHIPWLVLRITSDPSNTSFTPDPESWIAKNKVSVRSVCPRASAAGPAIEPSDLVTIASAALNPSIHLAATANSIRRRNLWALAKYATGFAVAGATAYLAIWQASKLDFSSKAPPAAGRSFVVPAGAPPAAYGAPPPGTGLLGSTDPGWYVTAGGPGTIPQGWGERQFAPEIK